MTQIVIGKVKEEGGCWGNMAPFPVVFQGATYRTTEALFQALRFDDDGIRSEIREKASPMAAKFVAKRCKSRMVVEPMSGADLDNMRLCLRLKSEQHPELREMLIESGDVFIVEDCTKRQRGSGLFWGAARIDGQWVGQNWLGRLWMELRDSAISTPEVPLQARRDGGSLLKIAA